MYLGPCATVWIWRSKDNTDPTKWDQDQTQVGRLDDKHFTSWAISPARGLGFLKIFLFSFICVCVLHHMYEDAYEGTQGGQKRALDPLELELQGVCKLPDMDVGNWTQILWESTKWS